MAGQVHKRHWTLSEVHTMLLEADRGEWPDRSASHDPGRDEWAGATWQESMDLMFKGWQAGVASLKVRPVAALNEAMRPQVKWDVTGSTIDMGAYMAGNPECMGRMVRRSRPARVVTIGVDKAISSMVHKDRIEAMGRNILTLVEGLRMAGIPSEVWVCEAVGARGDVYDLRVKVQEAGRPLDVSHLAYWVGHPAALRRSFFALEELEPQALRDRFGFNTSSGYGMVHHGYAKDSFSEWAPTPQSSDATISAWVNEVINRRVQEARI